MMICVRFMKTGAKAAAVKRCMEFKAPIQRAAKETNIKTGKRMRVSWTVN